MGTPFFHELKKQASYFFKEKIRTARLALTDVTPAELLTKEATNGNPWAPDARTMGFISRAAFEIDDYWRIVEILHKRLAKFDRKHWRKPYKALILLEHLLTHGPESTAEEFQSDKEVMQEMENFQFIDERGFNWGLTVRKKTERVLKLLEKGPVLTEERDRARRITRGIQGFGSFNLSWSSTNKNGIEQASNCYGRSNSHYEDYSQQEDIVPDSQKERI
ncbi:clathrin interactor 1 [Phoenix dactylifera]|uniref:Clathrin interactor 1 n=1 Tax=Phoenix dactylifera TaxID=42345 RepID=A0A8B7CN70_PHODC|nr:clathrin interactor 1 [Phoenix dactylifera]